MLAYLAIFGSCLAGYAGAPPWIVAASAIALMALSYAEHHGLYRRGQELGLIDVLEWTLMRSAFNAVIAAGGAYVGGWVFRLI